jgi:ferredoxin--NADP+ reductase
MILRSVGYKGSPLPGVPYDTRKGTIPNELGRVFDPANDKVVSGEYVVGWAKRGPTGVIGTNKPDSIESVNSMFEDLQKGKLQGCEDPNPTAAVALLMERGVRYVTSDEWRKIDAYEVNAGKPQGRPRVKLIKANEMLDVLAKS